MIDKTDKYSNISKIAQEIINQFNLTPRNIKIIIAKMCLMDKINSEFMYWRLLGEADVIPFSDIDFDVLREMDKKVLNDMPKNYLIDFRFGITILETDYIKRKLYLRVQRK